MSRGLFILSASLLVLTARAVEYPVADVASLKKVLKTTQPGDVLVLAEGDWLDARIKIKAEGAKDKPITVRAKVAGKTVFTGDSRLSVSGHHVVVEGLWFRDPTMQDGDVIELRTSSHDLAYDCTIRGCAVTSVGKDVRKGTNTRFCSIYGTANVIESCSFEGKTTGGPTMVMWLTDGGEGQHLIRGNYFGPRPRLGENGGESIRLGDSHVAHLNGHCEVSGNLFECCNGEVEIISVKSNENRIVGNTFRECEGAVTLRHSHRSLVAENIFVGNHKKYTGGVRVIGEDHKVLNNWMENLRGEGTRSALTFMNAIHNSPADGYYQVKRALVEGNVLMDCDNSFTIGAQHNERCVLPPLDCVIRNNIVRSPDLTLITLLTQAPGWKWEHNVMIGKALGIDGLPGVVGQMPPVLPPRPPELEKRQTGAKWLK